MKGVLAALAAALAVVLAVSCATTRPAPAKKTVATRSQAPQEAAAAAPAPPEAATEPEQPAAPGPDEEDTPAETGLASYYADSLAGSRTASGERYRPDDATCAHRTLPFGTLIDITVVGSGLTATCRVNDRGPWADGRVVDVSKQVAKELGMVGPGVLEVTVRKHED